MGWFKKLIKDTPKPPPPAPVKRIKVRTFGSCKSCGSSCFIDGCCEYCNNPKEYKQHFDYGSSGGCNIIQSR